MRLIPQDKGFFDLFKELAACLEEGAGRLHTMLQDIESIQVEVEVQRLKDIEHKGDEITHALLIKVNKTFITPLDREDIHRLASALDDVLDFIYAAGERVVMFDIHSHSQPSVQLADIIQRQCQEIGKALDSLDDHEYVLQSCRELNRLEKEADRIFRGAVATLFKQEKDPVTLIKMKELFEFLETATDKAEDAGNVLESVVLKNS